MCSQAPRDCVRRRTGLLACTSARGDEPDVRVSTAQLIIADLNQVATDQGPEDCVEAGLIDVGRGFGSVVTQGVRRIDFAFVDAPLARCVESLTVIDIYESDHKPW
jgi:hypothetical protein